jgi:hypothetical protein
METTPAINPGTMAARKVFINFTSVAERRSMNRTFRRPASSSRVTIEDSGLQT